MMKQNSNLMKKLIYVLAVSATGFFFQGCGSGSGSATDTSDTTAMAADSMAAMGDTSAMATDQMDIDFANKAAIGGMAEVEFGKLAQEKGSDAKVKEFAAMMVKDHGMANEELSSIAKMKNITLPAALDNEHDKKLEELKSKSGKDFDKAYVMAMVEGHQKTLDLMTDGATNCKDSDLKAFAAKTGPTVKMHLDMINKIQAEMK
jgi:putative membrane protein